MMSRRRAGLVAVYSLIFLSDFSQTAIYPILPTFKDHFGLSALESGILYAAGPVATLAGSLPMGLLAHRVGARRVLVAVSVLLALSCIGQGFAPNYLLLVASRAAFGVAYGAIWTVAPSWLADAARTGSGAASALAPMITCAAVGFTISPALSGFLTDHLGVEWPFALIAGASTAIAILFLAGHQDVHPHERTADLRPALRAFAREGLLKGCAAMMLLFGMVTSGISLLAPLQLDANGVSASWRGVVFSASAAVFSVVSLIVSRHSSRTVTLGVAAAAAISLGLATVIPAATSATAAVVAFVVLRGIPWGLGGTISFPLGGAGAHRAGVATGSVFGLVNILWGAAGTVSPIVLGEIADVAGNQLAYLPLTGGALAIGFWLLALRARTPPPDPEGVEREPAALQVQAALSRE
jgi:predicted MFS family arabinose efflux permease